MRTSIRYTRSPIPGSPFSVSFPTGASLQHELRRAFSESVFSGSDHTGARGAAADAPWTPRVDVREEADRFVILADLPGVDPQDVEVLMDKGVLSLRGERQAPATADGTRFSRVERRHGGFHRRFVLPDSADADGVTASGRNGVLEIRIPKHAERAPRRVQVEVGASAPVAEALKSEAPKSEAVVSEAVSQPAQVPRSGDVSGHA